MKKTICLNMIVKNEADVIRRCLASVRPLIDCWVIVDTGSSDGTQEIIRDYLSDLPGELYERPWVNFGHNRNEALGLARGDYVLFIDADDQLVIAEDFSLPPLELPYYMVTQRDVEYKSDLLWVLLIDRRLDWKWVGVAHETLVCPEATECGYLSGIVNLYLNDGHRSRDPKKKAEVIRILKEALESEPQNARYAFYLAQAYRGAERYREAIEVYERRTKMGGSGEEIYSSLYWMARLQEELGMDPEIFIGSFAKAHQHSPSRVEPLYSLVAHYIKIKQFLLGYHVVNYAFTLAPLHCSATYVQKWMYEWGILYELFVCAFSIGKKSEARQAAEKLFSLQSFPDDLRKNIQRHL